MSSTSMPPPPAPLSRRRTRLNPSCFPLSPPTSPSESPCTRRKMSLAKGATFHISSSPPTEEDPVLSIRHLARRSPTGSRSSLLSLLPDQEDALKSIKNFEETFSGARGNKLLARRLSGAERIRTYRALSPSDEGLGSSISPSSEKGLASTFDRILDLVDDDSGLGSSIHPSEEDGLIKDLIQDADTIDPAVARTRLQGNQHSLVASTSNPPPAITHSIAPRSKTSRQPRLSKFTHKKISQNIVDPILREDCFRPFHPLVATLGSKSNKSIRCLRDVEQSLIFQPLTLAISQQLYRRFGEFSIQLVVDTYQQLSEHEQRRAADRPYNSGYFLDLVQQVGQLAAQIGRARQSRQEEDSDEDAYSPDDEIVMEGGLADTGAPAELCRVKRDGKKISLRTGKEYEPTPGIKRQHPGDEDDDVERSMARRKKGVEPKIVELKCSDRGCGKIFTRNCDLAKHEKTHTRPFKCPNKDCKYHELGLPTEKERDRHINDKHDPNPHFYKCDYCEFKTKRESNCKQHMEKKHDWEYQRAKGNAKRANATPGATPKTPSMGYSPSEATPEYFDDGSSIAASNYDSTIGTPYEQPANNFSTYTMPPQAPSWTLFPRTPAPATGPYVQADQSFGFNMNNNGQMYPRLTPVHSYGHSGHTPVTPAFSNISPTEPIMQDMSIQMDYNGFSHHGMPTPDSALMRSHSRNLSTYESPIMARQPDQTFSADYHTYGMTGDQDAFVSQSQLPHTDDFRFNDFALTTDADFNTTNAYSTESLFQGEAAGDLFNNNFQDEGMDMDDFIDYGQQ